MLTKICVLSNSILIFSQPILNISHQEKYHLQNSDLNNYFDAKNIANEAEKQVINNNLMNINIFRGYKSQFLKLVKNYFKNEQLSNAEIQKSHIFDVNFWKKETKFWWAWTNLYIWLSSIAIQQFTEGISMGVSALAFVAGLSVAIPGAGLAVAIYMVANMTIWRQIDQGKGVTSRYLFVVIPTGYWAET